MKQTTLLFFVAVVVCSAYSNKFEPSVAFVCDRGSMHMHEDGNWASDPKTDCMESKSEILAYCKKSYPALDITNIVESSDYKHIKGWCALGKTGCSTEEAFKVRPFRCLTGPFQSDALIVPKKCAFDHVHQPKQCHGFDWWRDVASKACSGLKHMKTVSYAMLLPCGTDMFTGVEYVCCPDGSNSTVTTPEPEMASSSVNIVPLAKSADSGNVLKTAVNSYLNLKQSTYKDTEHGAYAVAKKELLKVNHDKVTKLMTDWEESRKRVMKLKEIDPKGAEKLNKEITARFQKEYFALQTSSDSKLLQLDAVHQQHVQSNLDTKKRKSVEQLMQELQADQPSQEKIIKELKRYISTEEKDAHHCIQHYKKIRERDGSQGQQMLPSTISHLTLISKRINQSIELLNALDSDNMKAKIVDIINAWRSQKFNSIELYISTFEKEIAAHHVTKKFEPSTAKPEKVTVDKVVEKLQMVKKPIITVVATEPKLLKPTQGMYKQFADKYATKTGLAKPAAPQKIATLEEEDEKEHEHAPRPKVVVNNMMLGVAVAAHPNVPVVSGSQSVTSNMSVGAGVAVAFGVVAGILVIVFSVVVAKNKRGGVVKPPKESYCEVSVEDNISAEDRHIASMQNGYENPTYKLLENRAM